jgi:uncharacterized protein
MTHSLWPVLRFSLAALLVLMAFFDRRTMNRLRSHSDAPNRKRVYLNWMVTLWVLAALSLALTPGHSLFRLPGSVFSELGALGPAWFKVFLACVAAAFFSAILQPAAKCIFRGDLRQAYSSARAKSPLHFMMPRGAQERQLWVGLSLPAGMCEELCFRGFLMSVAREELHLSLLASLLTVSIAFGWAHLYQGFAGILQTGVTGLMFGFVSFLTGNLLLPYALHALTDLQILALFRPPDPDPALSAPPLSSPCSPA